MHTSTTLATLLLAPLALTAPTANSLHRRQNLQTFAGAVGGIAATPIVDSGNPNRPFQVKQDTFVNLAAALQRSCDQQFNACANEANGGGDISVAECAAQKNQCSAAGAGAGNGAANGNNGNGNANGNNNGNGNGNNGNGNGNGNGATNANNGNGNGNGNGNANNANCTRRVKKSKRGNKKIQIKRSS